MGCLEDDIDYALREIRRPTRVYVASSWRNEHQPKIVQRLRELKFEVYDFRGGGDGWKPSAEVGGFAWSQIDVCWKQWNAEEYIEALASPVAQRGFDRDMNALKRCDICLFVMPCGSSASMEMGWAAGAGYKVVAYIPDMREPDLMVKMASAIYEHWIQVESEVLQIHRERVHVPAVTTVPETKEKPRAIATHEYPCDCGFC